ncbi:MAG TPA: hypothetical protein VFV38_47320 [Ktedonobacteraceae bacterium]|nr:hypothetical protein [Ktedonobacteraceae bacterium]
MQINWLWFVGFIPYALQWQRTKDEQWVRIRALYWHVVIRWHQGHASWKCFVPLIEHGSQEPERRD